MRSRRSSVGSVERETVRGARNYKWRGCRGCRGCAVGSVPDGLLSPVYSCNRVREVDAARNSPALECWISGIESNSPRGAHVGCRRGDPAHGRLNLDDIIRRSQISSVPFHGLD
jgi:hypothetical protein